MADQTFTAGQVLTAAQMTTLQSNSGLVVVTPTGATGGTISGATVTVGAAVSSVTVSGAFSTTFDNYKIMWTGGVASAGGYMRLQIGGATTGYYTNQFGTTTAGAFTGTRQNNTLTYWDFVGVHLTSQCIFIAEIQQPFLTQPTQIQTLQNDAGGTMGVMTGYNTNATSYTSFTITPSSGTFTGGTITVLGYRK
jgi:hypothetical protein